MLSLPKYEHLYHIYENPHIFNNYSKFYKS